MTIHILVEGSSERAFFDRWAPRLLLNDYVRVHPHQGKGSLPRDIAARPDPRARGLLDQLPAKLRGLAASLDPQVDGVLVLVDADADNVHILTDRIMSVAKICAPQLSVEISVAVEEMEAFYLGDLKAIEQAYPNSDMEMARNYVPDSICGTWELFGQVIGDGGGNKVAWAEEMGPLVTTRAERNRSPSFRKMVRKILSLQPEPQEPKPKRKFRHAAKRRPAE